ncbi:MAG: hypothetical protein KGJ60_06800 [Verrucomicrobiota bacterium]|nr:hypothetical protein [Verrucomicrobiota bacterium]
MPAMSDPGTERLFPNGVGEVKPYPRFTSQPDLPAEVAKTNGRAATSSPNLSSILHTTFGFWHSKVLLTATASGDFFKDPPPKADIITMGMILHDWNLEKKMHLIRATYDALPPGGALVAIESLIDDARRENTQGLLMSLNMLIEFGDAFDYSGADFRKWCGEAGFKRFEVNHLAGSPSAAVAYK